MKTRIIIALIIFMVLIQFIPVDKNINAAPQPNALKEHYELPENIDVILKAACNDCHSNNTQYPWYAKVQPVAWWLSWHVKDGKKHLNFDEFATYPLKKQAHKLEEVIESQEEGWMPLSSYNFIHEDARLSDQQKQEVIAWAKKLRAEILQKMASVQP